VLSRSFFWIGATKYPPIYTKRIAPIRSAIEHGVIPTIENEAGVVGLTARTYMYGAVPFMTRRNEMGNDVAPEEAVDRNTMLKMMTSWPARFVMKENVLGTLENGKYADFLVMNGDLTTAPVEQLAGIFPVMTVVGGQVRVLRKEFADELGRQPVGPQINFDNKARYVDGE
jgi:predicted amidohydrolase YtcJ